ncbi:hypothetical protein [Dictyobacter aurantiacus]|uniref:Uncharacterized protein n=1 Tax=Dictyobacter aurantiacus TaxID=1936993 RepID=A0A401ZML6_9CHLR|nr:hypothetical protein [Dictyobacter aurantiacus]GCE08121.1 hypothetical protein KDAU_54500 [Dictyobacter aurantiacus]
MPDLQIQHVIFTRVERAYSPNNVSGYQIAYKSAALGNDTTAIEKRLQCFEPGRQESARYQFFWTEQGQAVLARSVPLAEIDPEVIDPAQRDAFLAHALVVSRADFARIRNDPFAIFDAAENNDIFAEDADRLVDYLRARAAEQMLAVPLRKRAAVNDLLEGWRSEDLLRLYHLGMQAPLLSRQGRSLLLQADDRDEIFNLLNVICMLIPPDDRSACTFDTWVDGCTPHAGTLWAVGTSTGRSHPGFLPIRLVDQGLEFKGGGDGFSDPKALARSA